MLVCLLCYNARCSTVLYQVYNSLLDLTSRIIAHERVQAQVSELISEGTHAVLNDEEVMEHGKEFLTEGILLLHEMLPNPTFQQQQ
jgi:hypothetical protein